MDAAEQKGTVPDLNIQQIMECIPHRYPFLMIEKLTQIVPHESAVAIKNVSVNEPQFQGHFPERPIMPGVLIVEAMAQAAACLVVHSLKIAGQGRMVYFMSIDEARAFLQAGRPRATSCESMSRSSRTAAMSGASPARRGSTARWWPRPSILR